MTPKTILITGATDGIGKQSALELAQMGHHVLVHGRNAARGKKVVDEIQRATNNPNVALVLADLSSLAAVRDLAALAERSVDTVTDHLAEANQEIDRLRQEMRTCMTPVDVTAVPSSSAPHEPSASQTD